MASVYFETGENYNIGKDKQVKVTRFNSSKEVEVLYVKNRNNNLLKYRKVNKNEYVDTETGELFEYNKNSERSIKQLRRSMSKLEKLLKNNFCGDDNELFVTLTTDEEVKDFELIRKYYDKFWRKLKEEYKGLEYIYVVELQENRNSWHIHALIKDTAHKYLYIDNEKVISKLWGKGHTKTKRITLDNMKELTADGDNRYDGLTAIERVIKYMAKTRSKEKIAVGKKTYYKSRGIKQAETEVMTYGEIEAEMGNSYYLNNEHTTLIKSTKTNCILQDIMTKNYKHN